MNTFLGPLQGPGNALKDRKLGADNGNGCWTVVVIIGIVRSRWQSNLLKDKHFYKDVFVAVLCLLAIVNQSLYQLRGCMQHSTLLCYISLFCGLWTRWSLHKSKWSSAWVTKTQVALSLFWAFSPIYSVYIIHSPALSQSLIWTHAFPPILMWPCPFSHSLKSYLLV